MDKIYIIQCTKGRSKEDIDAERAQAISNIYTIYAGSKVQILNPIYKPTMFNEVYSLGMEIAEGLGRANMVATIYGKHNKPDDLQREMLYATALEYGFDMIPIFVADKKEE